jgi:hypothetical protein
MLALLVLTFGTLGTLALLVSRGRSRSAKWVLVLLWVIGLPMFLSSWNAGTVIGWRPMAMLQAALQVAALALLFTRSARDWPRAAVIHSRYFPAVQCVTGERLFSAQAAPGEGSRKPVGARYAA